MKKLVEKELRNNDILIMASAVADYKPAKTESKKLKKEQKLSELKLLPTEDILASIKKDKKIVVGFALETDNELTNAKKKLKEKDLDLMILNSLKDKKSGFEFDTNKITILKKTGKTIKLPLMNKFQIANKILDAILKY